VLFFKNKNMRRSLHFTLVSLALFFISNFSFAQSITPSTATLTALSTDYGTVSSEVSFTFTASALDANEPVTITAPTGFEVSLTTLAGFANFVNVNANGGGNIASTSIFVRLKATALPATYSGNVTLSGTITIISANVATTLSTVNEKTITITGVTATNKQYDRTTTATLSGAPALNGVLPADVANVTLNTGSASGTFDNFNVGTGKTVTTSGYAITGTASSYYTLTQPTTTANVTAKNLTITGLSANNKPFDNNTTATLSGTATLNGIVSPDVVTTTGSIPAAVFANVGPLVGISVTVTGYTLAGAAALNYTVSQPTGLTATITSALPTTQPSGMTFTNITNNTLRVNYSAAGNGSARILVAKSGSVVSLNPVAGTTYTADGNFSTGTDLGSGNIVVGLVTSTTAGFFDVTNLTPNTTYHFALYEFNGTAGLESYNTTTPLIGSQTVLNEPANHVTGFTSSASATAISLNWTGSTGSPLPTNYLVLARDVTNGGAYLAFSDGTAAPANDANLSSQTSTWQGAQNVNFGTNTFNGWTNLTSGNQYEFEVYPYTTGGSVTPDFKTDGVIPTTTVFTEPSASAGNPTFSDIASTSIDVTVGGGTGVTGGYLVIRKSGSAPTATPVDRTSYTPGNTIAASETIVYTGAAGLFTDSGLSPVTTYHYAVYAYSGSGTNTNYRITSPGAANSTTLCSPPTIQASNLTFTGVVEDQMTVNWTRGNGNNVIVFARAGATATADPVNGTTYTANSIFGSGTNIAISGADYFAVYSGTGTSVTVTGLSTNTSYNFHVFEYTTTGLCYLTSIAPADASQTTTISGVNGSITTVSAAATISSIANTSGAKVAAFTFKVTDDNADSSPTRISALIFRPGTGNTITNFSDLLLGADLTDQYGNIQTANITIGTNTITITGITSSGSGSNSTNTLGRTDDGTNKNYNLNVWLKTSFGGTISPATVDGQKLVFSLAANDITYNTSSVSSSGILAGSSCEAGSSNGVITVVATKININQQPANSAVATVALSTQPIFEATDANNNRDININNAITVLTTNPNNLGSASVPSFSNGLANFTGSGFNFPNAGTSTMAVNITSPNLTSPNSNSITVTASTTLGASFAALAANPLFNSSTGNAVLGFSLQTTGSTLNLTSLTFTSNVSVSGLVNNFKLFSNSSDSFSGATEVAASTTQTFSGLTLPLNGTIKYFYLVVDVEPDFPTANPQIEFSLTTANLTVSTGNKAGLTQTGPLYDLVDQTPPEVTSIDISSPTESWSTVNGSSASTLTWLVTFSESVTGVDATDFILNNPGGLGVTLNPIINVTGSGNTRTITLNNVQLISPGSNRQIYIDLVDDNSIVDNVGLALGGIFGDGSLTSTVAFPGSNAPGFNDYYTVLFKEPSNAASGLTINRTTTSLTVGWTNPVAPVNPTSFYFVQVKKSTTPSFPALNDGTYIANLDSDATDGSFSNLYSGTATSAIINSLPSGLDYDVRITALSYSGFVNSQYLMDYLNSSTLNGSDFTTTAVSGTLSGSGPTMISSIIDTPAESQTVFTFNILDDGAISASDNAPLKFSQLVVTPGTGNTVANWTTIIAGAELTNGASTIAGTVNAGNITFSSLNSTPTQATDLGYVADNENKQYQLKIWLNTSVTDNSKLAFRVNNSSFTYNNTFDATNFSKVSSQLAAGQIAESGAVNINVAATKLAFTTQPPAAIGVATPFSSMGTPPVVRATDANNNLDTDYAATFNVTPSTGVVTSITNFTAGTLTLSSFYFSTAGSRTMTITGNSTGAPFNYPALSGPGVEALSTSVNAVISNKTTITEATPPASELASFSSTTNAVAANFNFDFTVTDDVGANGTTYADNDGLPTLIQTLTITQGANNGTNQSPGPNNDASTFDDWTKSIAGAQLTDGVSTVTIAPGTNITSSTLIFPIPSGSSLRTIADGGAKTYQLKIWLKNPVDATLQDILDNKDFSFAINQGNIDLDPTANVSSTLASGSASTGDGKNIVTVTASQLDFITQWTTNAAQSYDAPFSPIPTAKARDANGNLDIDFNATVSVSAFDVDGVGPKTYPLTNSTVTVNNGNISFNANLQVSSSGNGSGNDVSRLIINSTGLTNGNSNNFVLGYSALSNIIKDTNFNSANTYASGNGYPENILYNTYQASTFTANTDGIALERFILQDGGGSNDADGTATKLQSITLNISNYQYLRTVAIYDGSTKIAERVVAGNITNISGVTGDLTFPSLLSAFQANDNGNNNFTVFATFNQTAILDNEVIQIRVNGATPAAVSSSFVTAGTITTFAPLNTSENENKIEVVATQIDFTTVPAAASISVPFAVQVSARDAFANLDLDYNGTITATETNPASDLLFRTLNNPSGAFVNGQLTYPVNFQFDIGDGNVQLTINSGAGSGANSVNAAAIAGTSPVISVISSYESLIVSSDFYNGTSRDINYINYQDANITSTANGFELDFLYLADGGYDLADADGALTVLDDLTLGISNPQSIKKIAIYEKDLNTNVITEIQELDNSNITVTNGYGQITFNNLNISSPDDFYKGLLILATFNSSTSTIQDRDTIQVSVLAATLNAGSKFAPDAVQTNSIAGEPINNVTFPSAAAAIQRGTYSPYNKLQAIATSLDFVTQPSSIAGINEPIDGSAGASPGGSTGIVHARDKFAVIDTDFTGAASATTISAAANPVGYPASFTNGILNLTGMRYANAGDGTLIVKAGVLDSSVTGVGDIGNSIACSTVDVIHVTAVRDDTNGVELNESLKGGTTSKRIFGLDYFAEHSSASEPSLTGFAIIFRDDNGDPYPYTSASGTVFKNFKLFRAEGNGSVVPLAEGVDYTLDPLETQTAALISSGAPSTSKDKLAFILTDPVTLYQSNYKFYLNVDIDVNVSVGTPPITPYLIDLGYGFNNTNDNIKTTVGSSVATVEGITRKFASVKPPVLVYTSPFNGQLNVDPALNVIKLKFDVPVVTFDGIIKVYNRDTGVLAAIFTASNGVSDGSNLKAAAVDTLEFVAPVGFDFDKDVVYYVTIEKGVFSNIDVNQRRGISDEGFNLYGGIEYNGTFYFKGSSPNPPELVSTDATKYYFSPTSATFNFQFNQFGKVHYMVVHPTSPGVAPLKVTNAQILGIDPYTNSTIIARGTTVIDQQAPNLQYVTINANLTNNIDYYVYAFAENDANPIPIPTSAPFGSSTNSFAVDADGPTLKIKKTNATTNLVNNPRFEVCSNSSVKMEEPIIISEPAGNAGDFATGFGLTDIQSFNILLPTGFQFDVTKTPTINFNGADFKPLPIDNKSPEDTVSAAFINTTILRVSFVNNGSTSFDNIIISNLYIIASATDINGNIIRFSGNGLTTISDGRVLARISAGSSGAISFNNSYNEAFFPWPYPQITKTVTYIPDNFATTVRLLPEPPPGDYGASFFSGSGLTNDILTLAAVTKDAAFNITLTHTDQNGCNSTTVEQYLVYDHTKTIPELLKTTVAGYNITGTKVGLKPGPVNSDNLIGTSDDYVPGLPTATLSQVDSVSYVGLAGYQLIDLYADIPKRTIGSGQVLDFNSHVWDTLVNMIPRLAVVDKNNNGGLHDFTSTLGQVFKTYNWEYSDLINKNLTGSLYPYDSITSRFAERVKSTGTANGKLFFNAGSLGIIEFTGIYQSTADFSVFVPFRQEVELFIPAVPVVEVSGESDRLGRTPIFCENGSPFTITGYPLATSSDVTGFFTLKDSVSGASITDPGFVDNGNGTATFSPSSPLLKNGYKTIKVEYTYKQNNSPAVGTGVLYIRVTPNPVANFTTSMRCEDIDISFTDTSTLPLAADVFIEQAIWSYADNKALARENGDTILYPSNRIPIHRYSDPGSYPNVSLSVNTNFGCANMAPEIKTLSIGGTPAVAFSFSGVSTADPITFTNESTIVNDVTNKLDWTFGDGNTETVNSNFSSPVINNYTTAGSYTANLKVTSLIGCNANLSKSVIVLPRVVSTVANPYLATFETDNGGWQHAPTDTADNRSDSWAHGAVNKILTKSNIDGTKAWATSLTGTFSANERSALYSPSFDISGLARPMISFDKFVQFNRNEGVIIQYSVDNKNVADETKEWHVLGEKIEEGVEWFNGQSIASKPGDQPINDFGWNDSDIKQWREAKHTISNVTPKPPVAGTGRVVFRFALAARESDLPITVDNEGFAIDNFRVGERTRIILHESFANTGNSSADELSENTIINNFKTVGTDVVRINYHTGFPGADPFNLDNPADNSSRALFYNVSSTPDSYLDGEYGGVQLIKQKFSVWGEKSFDKQTLSLANAKIDINQTIDGDGIKINVDVTAIETTIPKDSVALFVAILEESVPFSSLSSSQKTKVASGETEFDYVLKKMLPSAAGTILSADITNGNTKSFGINDETFTWKPDPTKFYSSNTDDLAVVAFLQNVITKKIYQSSIVMDLDDPIVNVVTGIEAILPEQVNVYPNPASKEFRVELPAFVQNEVPMNLIDLTGRKHDGGVIRSGSNEATVSVENLSEGIYILEIGSGSTGIIRKKIMVVMKN